MNINDFATKLRAVFFGGSAYEKYIKQEERRVAQNQMQANFDIKIKRMQDRIAELESAQDRWKILEKKYIDIMIKQAVLTKGPDVIPVNAEIAQMFRDAMSETTPQSEIK